MFVFFLEALAQSGAKRQGGTYLPPPCAVEGCGMACAGEGYDSGQTEA